jgi:hypothetical protein
MREDQMVALPSGWATMTLEERPIKSVILCPVCIGAIRVALADRRSRLAVGMTR